MKKFTVLVVLALLAATGTSYAVTCAQDNVPAATVLVPYFKVSIPAGHDIAADLPKGGVDTMVAITNVSEWGIVAHVTVWNKQSVAVFDFNIPMTGFDVVTFRMREILNGSLNPNISTFPPEDLNDDNQITIADDPCDDWHTIGNSQMRFQRFTNPDAGDRLYTLGYYGEGNAFGAIFRPKVWRSLDEGFDYADMLNPPSADTDNPVCEDGKAADKLLGDFTGYITIDVTNFCTNFFPDEYQFYTYDAIATMGWGLNGGPNVLMGDVFFVDSEGGAITGDSTVALEFDSRLDWTVDKTFYNRYTRDSQSSGIVDRLDGGAPIAYTFIGDGREPLGLDYGFRYLNLGDAGTSFLTVWRSDLWWNGTATADAANGYSDLCYDSATVNHVTKNHEEVTVTTYDEDENDYVITGGGPSGDDLEIDPPYIWWETQRILVDGNIGLVPDQNMQFGWTEIEFPSNETVAGTDLYNQAYVGISHLAPGEFVSVGHSATLLDNQFTCNPISIGQTAGNVAY